MEFKITKEQILEMSGWGNIKDLEKVKSWFPDVFKHDFKVGKWYKHPNDSLFCITKIDNRGVLYGYGFFDGKYDIIEEENSTRCACNEVAAKKLTEADREDVIKMLKKEAEKRGFKEWFFIKRNFNNLQDTFINPNTFPDDDLYFFSLQEDYLEMNGFVIYSKGQWAEIIPTMTKQEAEQKLNCKIV